MRRDARTLRLALAFISALLGGVIALSIPSVSFQQSQALLIGLGTTAVALGDLNHDELPDIITATLLVTDEEKGLKRLYVAVATGSPQRIFSPPQLIEFHTVKIDDTVKVPRGKVLALGDLNHDKFLDLVLAYPTGGSFWVLWGDAQGALRPVSSRDLPRGLRDVSAVALADFTNDGRLDIICTNLQGSVYVFINNGTERIDRWSVRETFVGGSLQSLAVSDLNRDGKLDAIVSSIGRAAVLLGDNTGSFALEQRLAAGLYSGDSPAWIELADINNDGFADLVTANPESDRLLIFVGDGQGKFDDPQGLPTGGLDPRAVIAGDFNQDGWLDLAAANSSSNTVTVHLNDGLGGFGAKIWVDPPARHRGEPKAITIAVGSLPVGIASGDVDRDSDLDMVVVNQGDGSVSVLLNERP